MSSPRLQTRNAAVAPTPGNELPTFQWWGEALPYQPTVARMEQVQNDRKEGRAVDTTLYLEHEPVVTYGRNTPVGHLGWASRQNLPTVEVPRGGLATYHGPGQLVGYLVIDLSRRAGGLPPDLHDYLRAMEEGLMAALEAEFGLPTVLRAGYTGVWTHGLSPLPQEGDTLHDAPTPVPLPPENKLPRKLAAIGVSCRRWVTAHGFALNIDPDLSAFRAIVPCGITDAETTSVRREHELAGRPWVALDMKELASRVHIHVAEALHRAGWCLAPTPTEV